MSPTPIANAVTAAPVPSAAPATGQWRALALVALLVGEALLALERIDTDALIGHAVWWVGPVRALAHNVPWGASVVAVAALLGAGRWRANLAPLLERAPAPREVVLAALAHGLWVAVFAALSLLVLAGGSTVHAIDAVLPFAWLGSALAATTSAALLLAPSRAWRAALAPLRGALVGGVLGGSALFWLGSFIDGNYFLWGPLADVTLRASAWFMSLYADAVYLDESTRVLGTDSFRVIVTKYCSGLEGLALFGLFFGAFLVLARHRLRVGRALVLLPIGLVLVWTFNAARIAALIALGHFVDPELAVDAFHTHAGWPPLIAVALGCVAIATRVPLFAAPRRAALAGGATVELGGSSANAVRAATTGGTDGRDRATTAYLLPLLAVVATALIAGAFLEEGSLAAPLRVLVAAVVLWRVRRELPELAGWRQACDGLLRWHVWAAAAACGVLWIALDPDGGAGAAPNWTAGPAAAALFVAAFVSFALVTPLVEELAFRGYLQRKLTRARFETVDLRRPAPLAVLGSALAFGLVHRSVAGGVVAGVLFSLAAARRGRLADAVWAHALVNAALAILAATSGDWGWWF